jgi:hypothetical protein
MPIVAIEFDLVIPSDQLAGRPERRVNVTASRESDDCYTVGRNYVSSIHETANGFTTGIISALSHSRIRCAVEIADRNPAEDEIKRNEHRKGRNDCVPDTAKGGHVDHRQHVFPEH